MRALTIKQPWAQLIVDGIKDCENRSWRTNFRGRIFIHASAKQPKAFSRYLTAIQLAAFHSYADQAVYGCYAASNLFGHWNLSAIIGEVEIVDCVQNHSSIWAEKVEMPAGVYMGEKLIWNWVLANPVKYHSPILNVRGRLSFWEPDYDLLEKIAVRQAIDEMQLKNCK